MVLRTFETEKELYQKFKALCAKEDVDIGDKINELIAKEVKEHGDGNPAYEITHWFNNPNMMAVPALFRNETDWSSYYQKIDEKQYNNMDLQLNMINKVHNKYGMRFYQ